jgi:UDP:flavonoid glycosyltransferase YjiC (YdhE family)
MRREFDPPLNAVRARFGLTAARDLFLLGGLTSERVLVLCPEAYCGRPPDWDPRISCAGYTCFDRPADWQAPQELEGFLAAGEPPVLLSLGTSVAVDPQSFYRVAQQALERIGARGLFLVGLAQNLPEERRAADAFFEYVPLSEVLPRCRAIVHPGGFGSTAAALVAGVPQVAVPRAFDQAYHGSRIEALGVGRSVPWRRLGVRPLERALRETLASEEIHRRAGAVAARIGASDGVRVAADALEELLATP